MVRSGGRGRGQGMNRKLLTALASAGAISIWVGATATPAGAVPRTFVVSLLGGSSVTLTLDVPPGTPVDQVPIPDLELPVVGITEVTVQATPTATAVPTQPPAATPGTTPTAPPASGESPRAPGAPAAPGGAAAVNQSGQETRTREPEAPQPGSQDAVSDLEVEVGEEGSSERARSEPRPTEGRNADGSPTLDDPGFTLATPGAAPIGVPNFFIEKFRIPPFLLPIYQAAGIQYGIRWEVLAAINEIETDYGRNLNVSTAGAVGWMQFLPSTWRAYGVDANEDGIKDPYNPVDAIFAAARYLRAAGAEKDLARAIFAYNHADWYVDSVLLRARVLGGLPSNFVGSLTGLTQGHFPVAARATYADDISEAEVARRKRSRVGNAAWMVQSDEDRRSINVYSRDRAPVIAVNDGKVTKIGTSPRLGRFLQLQDVYGNTYTYGHLESVARLYPAPKHESVSQREIADELALPEPDAAPQGPASAGKPTTPASGGSAADVLRAPVPEAQDAERRGRRPRSAPAALKERLFANPFRRNAVEAGGGDQVLEGKAPKGSFEVFKAGVSRVFGIRTKSKDVTLEPLRPGAKVVAGTVLGRVGETQPDVAPHVLFEIRPAGRGAPRIDPKPILDGWKLLESTAIYRAAGQNPFFGDDAVTPTIGQVLLMSKQALQRQVLGDPRIQVYGCGRRDIDLGQIDRRVLATLKFLSLSGLKPTVTSLKCGHGYYTASGNVSHHSSGNAVDIAAVNGIPILGHQGSGSITDITIQRLLTLQGLMKPAQIISLMTFRDADNTVAMSDHADHIHVGFQPLYGTNSKAAKQVNAILEPDQWIKLIDRLGEIDNPTVARGPSKFAIKADEDRDPERASDAHVGE